MLRKGKSNVRLILIQFGYDGIDTFSVSFFITSKWAKNLRVKSRITFFGDAPHCAVSLFFIYSQRGVCVGLVEDGNVLLYWLGEREK